jgi:hypothetical protein
MNSVYEKVPPGDTSSVSFSVKLSFSLLTTLATLALLSIMMRLSAQ